MSNEEQTPKEQGLDHTLALLREGYLYIPNRRQGFGSDVFETRLLGKKAICLSGKDAAELFYDNAKFKRKGAAPERAAQTLFGKNGVQSLDGEHHKHRKELFMSVMTREELKRLAGIHEEEWHRATDQWDDMDEVILYDEAKEILCRTACRWTGVPVLDEDIPALTEDLAAMYESPTAVGPKHWAGRRARNRLEKWMKEIIGQIRQRSIDIPETSIVYKFAWHRDLEGQLLDEDIVSVEMLNLLRPMVAISIFITFLAHALHQHPEEAQKLKEEEGPYQPFIQEVRRFYPFFPFVGAIVKKDFTWNGFHFEKGTLSLLDLYGTNHDSRIWDNPDQFRPSRFENWEGSPFNFIPQGGGDYFLGHRCAGEFVTLDILNVSLHHLLESIEYEVPRQDLSYSLVSMPSLPHSRMILKNVRKRSTLR
ncbi:cytochrome P450 [Bacillus sp. Marseille-Q1617]|uniref:cytochrome P450 n=1 Tax=Bacillus sp. Marseille-Q1617 TaxID=2736887 RepID=UPI00158E8036|nr:cytochrome P450 [Bacillus sp. Marseille-Q1617]